MTKSPMNVERFEVGERVRSKANDAVGTVTRRPQFRNDYYRVTWDEPQPFNVTVSKVSPMSLTNNFERVA